MTLQGDVKVGDRLLLKDSPWSANILERKIVEVTEKHVRLASSFGYEYWVSIEVFNDYKLLEKL